MANYFASCKTTEQVRSRYRELIKQHHPDRGGSEAEMREVNAQYQRVLAGKVSTGKKAGPREWDDLNEYEREVVRRVQSEDFARAFEDIAMAMAAASDALAKAFSGFSAAIAQHNRKGGTFVFSTDKALEAKLREISKPGGNK